MGTFHRGKGPLHGRTVVVDTYGPELYIGRCDDVVEAGVLLQDADLHRDDTGGPGKEAFLARAARVGHWPRIGEVLVPSERVASVRLLAEV
ncbi:MAG TPA: hypothetical protein VLA75_10265 [Thermoanaerobaculia bacterium]|nr:hypothetical protein [Thermoanaerobaculia bacterium]